MHVQGVDPKKARRKQRVAMQKALLQMERAKVGCMHTGLLDSLRGPILDVVRVSPDWEMVSAWATALPMV